MAGAIGEPGKASFPASAMQYLKERSGTRFDPDIVDAFLRVCETGGIGASVRDTPDPIKSFASVD